MLLMSACTSEPAATQPSETQTSTDKQTEKQTEKQTDKQTDKSTQDISGGGATPETPEPPSGSNDMEEKMYHTTYVRGSISGARGQVIDSARRFRTSGYLDISKIEAIAINAGYCLTWFAYDKDMNYLGNGSNTYPTLPTAGVWLADGKDVTANEILAWNKDTALLRFAVKATDERVLSLETDVAASGICVYEQGYRGDAEYLSSECNKVAKVDGGRQDGDIYGEYYFSFDGDGNCKVYSLVDYSYISSFTLDKAEQSKPHSNSVSFGKLKYGEDDEFPLLYTNIYNTYGASAKEKYGTCNVYRITRSGESFESRLVQIIKIGFTDDTALWASPSGDVRPYGNFAVDGEGNKLYAFTMRDASRTTEVFAFELPTVTEGVTDATTGAKLVTLDKEDILKHFSVAYSNYVQGAVFADGKIYSLEGFFDAVNRPAMKVIDVESGRIECSVDFYGLGLAREPEAVFVRDGIPYYMTCDGDIYRITLDNKEDGIR